ncbi:ADP-forming succinate--CoA ligase subunit beta [Cupriavidus sp. SZY C1]|uniref:ADP-forming succinate--CoA ligase subunit beta n=1 Tax=Cupriavidus sp. SZY C1 TaxID=3055037 RepID=UPI0028B54D68|nr:ADP-forming succinate--CoA ligase subunit beta [Cupriavidus sp. SZY C1]MDT6961934.1 ADP-forming succinate--CoA ligase subunit beta [Cupriavidus sp. SZY C1]
MNIHEHQAKELLRRYDVPVPPGCVAFTPDEAAHAARKLGGPAWIVKAQIHAGGRDVGRFAGDDSGQGGVRVATSIDAVQAHAAQMLGQTLVTGQTGPAGRTVRRFYVEKGVEVERELFLGIEIDRATSRVAMLAAPDGDAGTRALKVTIDPATGIQPFHARRLACAMGLSGRQVDAATRFVHAAYRAFTELDASLLEIHPLGVTGCGDLIALDATFRFDDSALFRHPEIEAMRDESEEDPVEAEAAHHGLAYVRLGGNIGCVANGAGLAMATMDLVRLGGAEPASFLDLRSDATPEHFAEALRLLRADRQVEGILLNLFGATVHCDAMAESVVAAVRDTDLTLPIVVRLEGIRADLGRQILRDAGLPIVCASHLAEAAGKIVAAVGASRKKGAPCLC